MCSMKVDNSTVVPPCKTIGCYVQCAYFRTHKGRMGFGVTGTVEQINNLVLGLTLGHCQEIITTNGISAKATFDAQVAEVVLKKVKDLGYLANVDVSYGYFQN